MTRNVLRCYIMISYIYLLVDSLLMYCSSNIYAVNVVCKCCKLIRLNNYGRIFLGSINRFCKLILYTCIWICMAGKRFWQSIFWFVDWQIKVYWTVSLNVSQYLWRGHYLQKYNHMYFVIAISHIYK